MNTAAKAHLDLDFYGREILQSLYPVLVQQYRYGTGWFAVGNSDDPVSADNKMRRIAWIDAHGPNAVANMVDAFAPLGGQPDWIAYGQSPDEAVARLVAAHRDAA